VTYYGLKGFWVLRVEGKLRKVVGLEMGFDCRKIRQGFCDYPGSVFGVTELEIFFNHTFDYLLQLHQVNGSCNHYWGVAFLFTPELPLLVV
jgi:hypothetical protein